MKKLHVSEDVTAIMKRGRGRYGIQLMNVCRANRLDMPMINLRRIALPIQTEKADVLPFDYNEILLLFQPATREGRSVADITGLTGVVTYRINDNGQDIPILTSDYNWLLHQPGSEFYTYTMQVDTTLDSFRTAVCRVMALQSVDDIKFIHTRRGDVYIRCSILGKEYDAVHMGRCDSRNLDEDNDTLCYEMAAKYYSDVLWRMAKRKAGNGKCDETTKEVSNG